MKSTAKLLVLVWYCSIIHVQLWTTEKKQILDMYEKPDITKLLDWNSQTATLSALFPSLS